MCLFPPEPEESENRGEMLTVMQVQFYMKEKPASLGMFTSLQIRPLLAMFHGEETEDGPLYDGGFLPAPNVFKGWKR